MDNKKYLNLGCGQKFHKDWVNIDFSSSSNLVISHNLLSGIPFKNEEFDVVYHSHVLEHFSKKDGYQFLIDCHRVLKKNGIIRIVVPDLELIIKEYLIAISDARNGSEESKYNYDWIMLELFDQCVRHSSGGEMLTYLKQPFITNEEFVYNRIGYEAKNIRDNFFGHLVKVSKKNRFFQIINRFKQLFKIKRNKYYEIGKFRLGGEIHQWMYDSYSLSRILSEIGFTKIEIKSAFKSDISDWNKYELDSKNNSVYKPDSLFIEAHKI